MKKKILLSFLFISSFLGFSQVKKPNAVFDITKVGVTSLQFSFTEADDLKSINWNDIKEIFSYNSDSQQFIELTFVVDLPESKNKVKGSFKVKGKQKEIEKLINRSKKLIKGLEKIIKKNR